MEGIPPSATEDPVSINHRKEKRGSPWEFMHFNTRYYGSPDPPTTRKVAVQRPTQTLITDFFPPITPEEYHAAIAREAAKDDLPRAVMEMSPITSQYRVSKENVIPESAFEMTTVGHRPVSGIKRDITTIEAALEAVQSRIEDLDFLALRDDKAARSRDVIYVDNRYYQNPRVQHSPFAVEKYSHQTGYRLGASTDYPDPAGSQDVVMEDA
jgi:hypothetical protein